MYKVYKHTCPNNKVYIGITSLKINIRWKSGKGYKNSLLFYRAINKYGWENIKHEILYKDLTKEEAEQKEIMLIKEYNSNNKDYGYNIECGGQTGAIGIKRSKETLIKMRKANLGKIVSEETKNKISNTLKGRIFTDEHRHKKSLAQTGEKNHMYGKKISKETREKMSKNQPKGKDNKHSRRVAQMPLKNDEIIKVWDCMEDIKNKLGISHCCISDCCRGKQKTSGGYRWRYYE